MKFMQNNPILKVWMCKSLTNMNYFDQIEREKLFPVYIYIYRDGRDVDISFKKNNCWAKTLLFYCKKMGKGSNSMKKIKKNVSSSRFISVKYEDLILNPKNFISYL